MILTIEHRFGPAMQRTFETLGDDPTAKFLRANPHLWPYYLHAPQGQLFVPPTGVSKKKTATACVNHGHWVIRCPFCPSVQHASRQDPLFFCARCLNEDTEHKSIHVKFPADSDEIERVLLNRPFITNRNWEKEETVNDLVAENITHGVAV